MRRCFVVLGCLIPLLLPSSARSDQCSDLQAAVAKATALKAEMQRETGPLLSSTRMPTHDEAACNTSQRLRDHIVDVIKLIDPKCVNDEQHRALAADLNALMREANANIGLFCN